MKTNSILLSIFYMSASLGMRASQRPNEPLTVKRFSLALQPIAAKRPLHSKSPVQDSPCHSFCSTQNPQSLNSSFVANPEVNLNTGKAPSNQELEQEHIKNISNLKRNATLLTALTIITTTAYLARQHHTKQNAMIPKRFIETAATVGASLTWTMIQSGIGCAALAFGYYKVHSWVYDSCIKEKQFNKLEQKVTTLQSQQETLQKEQVLQARAINDHAHTLNTTTTEITDHERVANDHADYLNTGRRIAIKIVNQQEEHRVAINNHAKILSDNFGANNSLAPATVSQIPVALPKGINEHSAAVPKEYSLSAQQNGNKTATTVPVKPPQSECWNCCKQDTVKSQPRN